MKDQALTFCVRVPKSHHIHRLNGEILKAEDRGFNLEETHLQDLKRIRELIAMVSIAYAFCVSLGIYINRKIKKIKVNVDKYKVNGFFRIGMNMIFENCRKPELIEQNLTPIFKVFTRFIIRNIQVFKYQILVV